MVGEILGMNSDVFYALLILLVLIILGIVTFHYYSYFVGGRGSALSAGFGLGASIFPTKQQEQQMM
jgi:hypothetical protein